jgi:predicted kinase
VSVYYFLIGIPGSGKSHLAKRLAEETGAIIVCPDDIRISHRVRSERAFEVAREEIALNLQSGRDVIFDATNTIRKWRGQNILAGKQTGVRVACCVMDTPLEWCLERQRRRVAQGEKVDLPENVIRRMANQLVDNPPELSEGFDEIRIFRGIFVSMTSGKFIGETRQVFSDQIDPMDLLAACIRHGDHWDIDYSWATPTEQFQWFRADMVCRAILAHQEGRPVHFDGREYSDLQKWGDAIVDSGQVVIIDRDDETGYWVKAVDPEPTKH